MLQFSLTGVQQPSISILINRNIVYEGVIDGIVHIDIDTELKDNDLVTLIGIGKRNGENGIWDTKVDVDGNIISDKYLIINNIIINRIDMGSEWIRSINALSDFRLTGIYKNGELSFMVHEPLLDWIIEEKFIKSEQKKIPDRSKSHSGNGKFDYEYIRKKISSINKLLND